MAPAAATTRLAQQIENDALDGGENADGHPAANPGQVQYQPVDVAAGTDFFQQQRVKRQDQDEQQ